MGIFLGVFLSTAIAAEERHAENMIKKMKIFYEVEISYYIFVISLLFYLSNHQYSHYTQFISSSVWSYISVCYIMNIINIQCHHHLNEPCL